MVNSELSIKGNSMEKQTEKEKKAEHELQPLCLFTGYINST